MRIRLRLSPAQSGAFECRDWSEEPIVRASWDGDSVLLFDSADVEGILSEITDASNAEDAHAEQSEGMCRTHANRAARSLATVTTRILKAVST